MYTKVNSKLPNSCHRLITTQLSAKNAQFVACRDKTRGKIFLKKYAFPRKTKTVTITITLCKRTRDHIFYLKKALFSCKLHICITMKRRSSHVET